MKFSTISATLALFTLANAMPATSNADLEARKRDKTDCETTYKKNLKKVSPAASTYCSSFIAATTTVTSSTTITQATTVVSTVPVTATSTATSTGPVPTVTQTVYSDCGIVGYDTGATPAYFFDGSGAFGTFATCQARCKQDVGTCMSFAFGSGQCLLYTANVAMTVNPVASSPYTFSAVNCPAPAAAPAAAPAPTVRKRQAAVPDPLNEYQPAERSAFCSCAIAVPSTSTVVVTATSTVASTNTQTTTATITAVVTSVVTPAPVTVTVTTTA